MRDRLIKIVKESLMKNIDYTHRLAENITDDLLSEGVIVPPVKVGQTVYYPIRHTNEVAQLFVREIVYTGSKIQFYASYLAFTVDGIGKTVFLTREEAEKALAERSENGKSQASQLNLCEECPIDREKKDDCVCGQFLAKNALALIKELTVENKAWQAQLISQEEKSGKAYYELACEVENLRAENERVRVVADMSDTTFTDALRIVNEFCDARIKRAKTDIVLNFLDYAINKAVVKDRKKRLFVSTEDLGKIAKEMLEETK